jgi:hypothetical protein
MQLESALKLMQVINKPVALIHTGLKMFTHPEDAYGEAKQCQESGKPGA